MIRKRVPRTLVPKSMIIRANTVNSGVTSQTSINPTSFRLFLNSLQDPLGGSGAFKPLGYTQWAAVYRRGTVLSTKITFTVNNGGSVPIVYGITVPPDGESISPAPWAEYVENHGTTYRLLSPDVDHGTIARSVRLKRYFNIKDWKDNLEDCSNDLEAHTGPARNAHLDCWVALHNGTTTTNINWIIKMEMFILLDQPRMQER